MLIPPPPLLQYERNFTSQFGEDGVIEHALSVLPARDRWCVEFGAWDGKFCSNTYTLTRDQGYSGVLIECEPARFEELKRTHRDRPSVIPLHRFVDFEGSNSLDSILGGTAIPLDFDLLSIDIDGNDYHIWDSLTKYRPKLVVIEFNPTIPNAVEFVQARDFRLSQGCSLASLDKLARSKGYALIHATQANGIFVDGKYFGLFNIADNDPAKLRADLSCVTWLFQTFDGRIHLQGNRNLLWHNGASMDSKRMQVLPRFLRANASTYSPLQKAVWKAYRVWWKLTGRKP